MHILDAYVSLISKLFPHYPLAPSQRTHSISIGQSSTTVKFPSTKYICLETSIMARLKTACLISPCASTKYVCLETSTMARLENACLQTCCNPCIRNMIIILNTNAWLLFWIPMKNVVMSFFKDNMKKRHISSVFNHIYDHTMTSYLPHIDATFLIFFILNWY